MNKAILMSIRPEWVAKILSGEKTVEIRKKFPKGYKGWVYIYCTKGDYIGYLSNRYIGKIVARFWCDGTLEFVNGAHIGVEGREWYCDDYELILKPSCLSEEQLTEYSPDLSFYAIPIERLEIFEKPKKLSEFKKHDDSYGCDPAYYGIDTSIKRAPQSYCWVEVGE